MNIAKNVPVSWQEPAAFDAGRLGLIERLTLPLTEGLIKDMPVDMTRIWQGPEKLARVLASI